MSGSIFISHECHYYHPQPLWELGTANILISLTEKLRNRGQLLSRATLGSSRAEMGTRAVWPQWAVLFHTLSTHSKLAVHEPGAGPTWTYFAGNHLTGARIEPFSVKRAQRLFAHNRRRGRGPCVVISKWVHPSSARPPVGYI